MATYLILSTNASGPGLCPQRREHLKSAHVIFGQGVPVQKWDTARLLAEQAHGTTFVVETGADPIHRPRADFAPCKCGQGYLLQLGPTAVDLTQEAIDKAQQEP